MFESIYKTFESFVVEFSIRRLAGAILLTGVCLSAFFVLDRYSPYFTMGRLERATGLLERLVAIESKDGSDDLAGLRTAIIRQVRAQVEPAPLLGFFSGGAGTTAALRKFGAGIGLWLLFALFYAPNVRMDPSNWNGVLGSVFIGTVWGVLGTLMIPDAWASWKFLVPYSVVNFAISVVLVLFWQARKTARNKLAG